MKRSTNVMLTLLVPAMSAFGCGRQPPPVIPQHVNQPANQQFAADCQVPAKPGEPEKPACPPPGSTTTGTTGYGYGYRSNYGSYNRGHTVFTPIFGGSGSVPTTPPHDVTSSSHLTTPNHASGASHPTTSHTSSASHVSRGGFGSSGAHASGGS